MNKTIIVSVMIGIAAFGACMFLIAKLPGGNIVTDTIKQAAAVAKS